MSIQPHETLVRDVFARGVDVGEQLNAVLRARAELDVVEGELRGELEALDAILSELGGLAVLT